ncbi:DUF4113 domain-containing protein [Orbus wheelerorum]
MTSIIFRGDYQLFFASQGTKGQWKMKQELLSPAYTTRIDDLKKVSF